MVVQLQITCRIGQCCQLTTFPTSVRGRQLATGDRLLEAPSPVPRSFLKPSIFLKPSYWSRNAFRGARRRIDVRRERHHSSRHDKQRLNEILRRRRRTAIPGGSLSADFRNAPCCQLTTFQAPLGGRRNPSMKARPAAVRSLSVSPRFALELNCEATAGAAYGGHRRLVTDHWSRMSRAGYAKTR